LNHFGHLISEFSAGCAVGVLQTSQGGSDSGHVLYYCLIVHWS